METSQNDQKTEINQNKIVDKLAYYMTESTKMQVEIEKLETEISEKDSLIEELQSSYNNLSFELDEKIDELNTRRANRQSVSYITFFIMFR